MYARFSTIHYYKTWVGIFSLSSLSGVSSTTKLFELFDSDIVFEVCVDDSLEVLKLSRNFRGLGFVSLSTASQIRWTSLLNGSGLSAYTWCPAPRTTYRCIVWISKTQSKNKIPHILAKLYVMSIHLVKIHSTKSAKECWKCN